MTHDTAILSRPFRVTRLSSKVPTTFELVPNAVQRAALAAELGIIAVEQMSFRGTLTPVGRHDFTMQGTLTARVVQACVVTLQPVRTQVSGAVLRRYLRDYMDPTGDEVELQDDSLEPLPEVIDAGDVAAEELALLLPEYPRAEGVVFAAPTAASDPGADQDDARPKPFAGLAELAQKLAQKTPDPDEKA